jgi:tRNA threonylcarbamoyladenosine biosynthesis protein TsaB
MNTAQAGVMSENWLVIETSGKVGKVGLARDGIVVCSVELDATRRHARDLAPTVGEVLTGEGLKPTDLTGVMVGIGPGSYTGLRVGVMSAKALAYATGSRLIAVPTFSAIVNRTPDEAIDVWVIADALQGQVYRQHYRRESDGWKELDELRIETFDTWLPTVQDGSWITGPGLKVFAERIPPSYPQVPEELREPSAESLFRAGRALTPLTREELFRLEPLYLRGSSAEEKLKGK